MYSSLITFLKIFLLYCFIIVCPVYYNFITISYNVLNVNYDHVFLIPWLLCFPYLIVPSSSYNIIFCHIIHQNIVILLCFRAVILLHIIAIPCCIIFEYLCMFMFYIFIILLLKCEVVLLCHSYHYYYYYYYYFKLISSNHSWCHIFVVLYYHIVSSYFIL